MTSTTFAQKHRPQAVTVCDSKAIISVMHNVMELGIANVCYKRKIFPSSFFSFPEIPSNDKRGMVVPQFDVEAIRSADSSTSISTSSSSPQSSNQFFTNSYGGEQSLSRSSSMSSTKLPNKKKEGELLRDTEGNIRVTQGISSDNTLKDADNLDTLLKNEARVLLKWLDGVGQALTDGVLKSVTLGICSRGNENKNKKTPSLRQYSSPFFEKSEENINNGDRLIESYLVSYQNYIFYSNNVFVK